LSTRKTGKEQYYTLPEVADLCVSIASKYWDGLEIVEPAGGTGEFLSSIQRAGKDVKFAFDIEPKHPDVIEQDFLQTSLFDFYVSEQSMFLSNPPFGRANSLAVKFFNHIAGTYSARYICFLIPKAWRKWSVQDKLNEFYHLTEDVEMPEVSFYNDDGPIEGGNLSTLFQVWEKRDTPRKKWDVEDKGYLTNSTPEDADVAITFFGHSSGRIETEFERVPNTTKRYFKASPEVIEGLKVVDYSRFNENVSYIKALSKKEINFLLDEYFS